MIGRPLSKQEMNRLVRHMGEIEQPWVGIQYLQCYYIRVYIVVFHIGVVDGRLYTIMN